MHCSCARIFANNRRWAEEQTRNDPEFFARLALTGQRQQIAIARALQVIEILAEDNGGLSLSELARRGITVNAVAPGFIVSDMTEALPEKVKQEMAAQIPLERFGTADDIANAVVFLATDASGYITGQVLAVNGGMYM